MTVIHDVPSADFTLNFSDDVQELTIDFHAEYLDKIDLLQNVRLIEALEFYFEEHLSFSFDFIKQEFIICEILQDNNGHFKILGELCCSNKSPNKITVFNNCFIELEPGQINSLIIEQKAKETRGFKMDKTRTKIELDL